MADMMIGNLHAGDMAVIVIYLAASIALGLYNIFKSKASIEGLFLAGRTMTWWPIGLSLFASNIGSVNYVGIAGDAAASGLAVVLFEWNAVFLLILLGWIFLPVYIASGIYTMPEYLGWRFGGKRLRIYLSVVALLTYVFTTVSSDLYSGALFMNQSLNINLYAAVAVLLLIGLIFTGLGGLETVIITDSLAVMVMVIGGLVLCILGFSRIGGMQALEHKYNRAVPNTSLHSNTTCGYPREDAWHIYRHPWNADYPSVALVLRTTMGALWYWCANQVLVQRALAAKNITHAKAGCIFAGYLKLMPMILMVFPGMISRALFPSVRGLMVASVIAAVVSSLTSIFNSSSAIFTMDIWLNIRPRASPKELLISGRIFTLILVGVSIMWIPVMSRSEGGQIFRYATTITGYMGAPTCAMFVLAMFWGRVNEEGAFWGMIIAQLWGIMRFILDMVYTAPKCGDPDERPKFISNFHAHYHTLSQIAMAFLIAAIISLATKAPSKESLAGLTYWTRFDKPMRDREIEEKRRQKRLNIEVEVDLERKLEKGTVNEFLNNSSSPPRIVSEGSNLELRERHTGGQPRTEESTENETDTGTSIGTSVTPENNKLTIRQRFVQSICGAEETKTDDDDFELIEDHSSRVASIKQTTFWRNMMNANAVILLVVTVFLNGFFY